MRVTLPVDLYFKTLSEVGTIEFVRHNSQMLVPRIFASSYENELGFAWILMELMLGKPLADRWKVVSLTAKEELVKNPLGTLQNPTVISLLLLGISTTPMKSQALHKLKH
jgi:hypothetical protein